MTLAVLDAAVASRAVTAALAEDLGAEGDVTSRATIPEDRKGRARFVARESLTLAGLPIAREVFRQLDATLVFRSERTDGDTLAAGATVAIVEGSARRLLEGERTALNFLQRLSGIATATRAAVDEVSGTGVTILDTRKTVPGLRALDKYAVATGGGTNHRMGLFDAVMVKDTHLGTGGSISDAVRACLDAGIPKNRVTAEVRTIEELSEAIAAGAGRALLDNMSLDTLAACVREGSGKLVLEASGGLKPGTLRAVAATGVDCLSLGYLTHSVRAADLAMDLEPLL